VHEGIGGNALAGFLVVTLGAALGCGDSSSGHNRGSQCTQVLQVACNRLGGTCMVFPANQISDCVQAGVGSCCAGNCGASVISTQADIDACVTDINAATCASLDVTSGGTLPASCVGVVRSALGSTPSALLSATRSPGERIGDIVAR
jgi:hypothetical protein